MNEETVILMQKIQRLQDELNDAICCAASKKIYSELEIHKRQVTFVDIVEVEQVVVNLNISLKGF